MPTLTLPDGKTLTFQEPVSVKQAAKAIGSKLAKVTVAGRVNDTLVDVDYVIDNDASLQIVRAQDEQGLEIIRHSTAHLLAQAVKRLYPDAKLAIGPTTEDGFYYDIDCDHHFNDEDLPELEAEMQRIADEDLQVDHFNMTHDEAIEFYRRRDEPYKVEILHDMENEEHVSFYRQGEFIDLCRGPHVPSTGFLQAFKLMKLAGAYWRGDPQRPMLQRIYGTAWQDKQALNDYLHKLEEAAKRDHRLLAKKMDLFHVQEQAPGMVFWHPKGWQLNRTIQEYIRHKLDQYGYQEIHTPSILARELWEASGHWQKFEDDMFVTHSEDREFVVKPMSCPAHVQIFNQGLKSYRDLPIRLAEFGSCHRNEPSGTLHGLMRVRAFVQDDGHIFCTQQQMLDEITSFNQLLLEVYRDFGFEHINFYLSTRPDKRIGADELWDHAEDALRQSLDNSGFDWTLQPGEGAFYGPKIEFSLKDCLGRLWQCGTMQVDYSTPERLGATYVDENGDKQYPIMLHRAIFGSVERFIGVLLEEYAGNLPLWLAPVQVVVLNITDRQQQYCESLTEQLRSHGVRAEKDLRNEKINYKIREHTIQRVPYLLVVGDQEVENNTVTVRTQQGDNLGAIAVDELMTDLLNEINQRLKEHLVGRKNRQGEQTA